MCDCVCDVVGVGVCKHDWEGQMPVSDIRQDVSPLQRGVEIGVKAAWLLARMWF